MVIGDNEYLLDILVNNRALYNDHLLVTPGGVKVIIVSSHVLCVV